MVRESNPGHPKYEIGVLITRLRHSIIDIEKTTINNNYDNNYKMSLIQSKRLIFSLDIRMKNTASSPGP
jgi:hypothetical protein